MMVAVVVVSEVDGRRGREGARRRHRLEAGRRLHELVRVHDRGDSVRREGEGRLSVHGAQQTHMKATTVVTAQALGEGPVAENFYLERWAVATAAAVAGQSLTVFARRS